ncbi:MAG: thermonuclease family protein [Pseudanabaenaceae cyanobacterium bins.39]|nr:thermonuclease family protein [Pseudanabaenaceae cyanobacterium bins.39]
MKANAGQKRTKAKSSMGSLGLVVVLILFLVIANMVMAFSQPKDKINGELWLVNRVVSGQTIEATVVNNPTMTVQRIRLIGISAPFKEQAPWGDLSRQKLSDLIKEQKVTLEFDVRQKDNSDRLLAYVWKDGLLINQHLVSEGLAIADPFPPNTKYDDRISRAQSRARLQELGIWNTQNPLRLSPRDFRRQISN